MSRIIDADALINAFTEGATRARNCKENALNNGDKERAIRADAFLDFLVEVKSLIDNATTVEPCLNCEDKQTAEYIRHSSSWNELQELRKFKAEHERPKGKWIKKSLGFDCDKCGYTQIYESLICEYHFCPNCGADMREADNESK